MTAHHPAAPGSGGDPGAMPARRDRLRALRDEIEQLRSRARARGVELADTIAATHPSHRAGAVNLAHYLALRTLDLRPLQERLSATGLSSLGRMESDVLGNLDAVVTVLDELLAGEISDRDAGEADPRAELRAGAAALLGGAPDDRSTRIMVTLPSEAATDAALVAGFAAAGMDLARINCAHDDPEAWARMAAAVRAARSDLRVAMDLAGPKVRTATITRPADKKHKKGGKHGKRPALRIRPGDLVTLVADDRPVEASEGGRHRIGCTLPEAVDALRVGHRVAFDDGEIAGEVVAVRAGEPGARPAEADVRIALAAEKGARLRAEKGINLPDTDLAVAALTDDDRAALVHVARLADIVQLSFTRSGRDVGDLFAALDGLERSAGAGALGVVAKIETPSGFRALPEILFALMRRDRVGVMIARGDLGVEVGFARLAEVQEEMLWLCEAARVPVIWATEVLDTLAATGVPTRAEVTDAAAGERAECVMLNKGPHIPEAIRALDDILRRMNGHVDKKRPLLRPLRSWSGPEPRP